MVAKLTQCALLGICLVVLFILICSDIVSAKEEPGMLRIAHVYYTYYEFMTDRN